MFICCHGWRAAVCLADGVQHAICGRRDSDKRIGILCDLHDWTLGMTWSEVRRSRATD